MKTQRKTAHEVWRGAVWSDEFTARLPRPSDDVRKTIYAAARASADTRQRSPWSGVRMRVAWLAWPAAAAALLALCIRLGAVGDAESARNDVLTGAAYDAGVILAEVTESRDNTASAADDNALDHAINDLSVSLAWLEQDVTYELSAINGTPSAPPAPGNHSQKNGG